MMISYVSFLFWIYDNCPCLYFNKEYDASVYKNKKAKCISFLSTSMLLTETKEN